MEDHGAQAPRRRDPSVEQILELHENFEAPEGHKVEVIGGNIIVSPSSTGRHALMNGNLHAELRQLMPRHLAVANGVTLDMTATNERYVPDTLVVSKAVLDTDEWLIGTDQAELVAEIVSPSSADNDRETKVHGCAASGVPIYLLVDPLERSVTSFSEPAGECYQQVHRVPFGASIELPKPYSCKLDTSVFA
jgi:Uma2 family endonuclease